MMLNGSMKTYPELEYSTAWHGLCFYQGHNFQTALSSEAGVESCLWWEPQCVPAAAREICVDPVPRRKDLLTTSSHAQKSLFCHWTPFFLHELQKKTNLMSVLDNELRNELGSPRLNNSSSYTNRIMWKITHNTIWIASCTLRPSMSKWFKKCTWLGSKFKVEKSWRVTSLYSWNNE